jgi:hypothetical protein
VKPIDGDIVSSNDGIEVGSCLSLCDEALLHESDDSGCGYYPRDLMCPSTAMRNRVVDENSDGGGGGCPMDWVCPNGAQISLAVCKLLVQGM